MSTTTGSLPTPSRHRSSGRRTDSRRALSATLTGYLPMILALIVIAFPLLWMLSSSFKASSEIVTANPSFLPHRPTLRNYADVAGALPIGRLFANSAVVTIVGGGVKLLLAITTAYAVVFIDTIWSKFVFAFVLAALMFPGEAAIIPNYITIATMGGRNTLWGIILPGLGSAFGTFLMRQQFLTLPRSLLEAAEIDGAGHWRKLWRIVVPVSIPTIATVGLITIVTEWNSYLWPLIITDTPSHMTLPVGLNLLKSAESSTGVYGTLMAGATLIIVPILIIFAALQKYIVAGLTQGAVKE
ncbi:carbohydrate ABC transporter permease [Acidipropionibacterium thoenii]|uniref:carbohydrate ABC transporter permease n=1 Tax=Acidipropionibacterium thoenii TaxID=1751 RepID=UPI00040861E8|nr:carbohydrate ABC transporter permease [Acidipropionibacterium thoenii]